MLTLADLGVLRDVEVGDDGTVVGDDHADLHRLPGDGDDARRPAPALREAGFARSRCARPWRRPGRRDWITERRPPQAGRARHRAAGAGPPARAGPVPLTLDARPGRGRAARAAGRADTERAVASSAPRRARRCAAAGPAANPSNTSRRSDCDAGRRPALPPPARSPRVERALRRRGRGHLRRPARAARTTSRFAPGQSLTLRRTIDGGDERRSYSICAPAGAAAAVGVREVPGGLFSAWLVARASRPGDEVEVLPPTGPFTADPRRRRPPRAASRPGPASRRCCRSPRRCWPRPGRPGDVALRQPAHRPVMFAEELADLKDRYPARLRAGPRAVPRAARGRAVQRPAGRASGCAACSRRWCRSPRVDHWWLCGPLRHGRPTPATVLAELGVGRRAGAPRAVLRRRRRRPSRSRHAGRRRRAGRRSEVTVVLDGRSTHR